MPAQGAATTLRERQVANRSSQVCPRVGAILGEGPSPPRIRAWWSWPCEPWRDCSLLSVSLWEGGALAGGKGITGTMQKQDRKAPCTLISSQFPAGTQRALSGHPVRLGSQLPCDPEQKGLSAEELIGTGGAPRPPCLPVSSRNVLVFPVKVFQNARVALRESRCYPRVGVRSGQFRADRGTPGEHGAVTERE